MRCIRVTASSVLLVIALVAMTGCNNAKLQELADQAKDAAEQGADRFRDEVADQVGTAQTEIQETLQLAGEIKLTLDAPVESKACYVRLIGQGGKRENVFELRSYKSPDKEQAPSIFFHAKTSAATVDELAGKVVPGRLFVQPTADGPTWYSATGSLVELEIKSIVDDVLTAELVNASLHKTNSDESFPVTGTFSAVPQ